MTTTTVSQFARDDAESDLLWSALSRALRGQTASRRRAQSVIPSRSIATTTIEPAEKNKANGRRRRTTVTTTAMAMAMAEAIASTTPSSASGQARTPASKKQSSSQSNSQAPRASLQRRNLKTFEQYYVAIALTQTGQTTAVATATVTPLQLHDAIRASLQRLHGLVGASFHFDILTLKRSRGSEYEGPQVLEALIRVPSEQLQIMLTSLASGIDLSTPSNSAPWRTHVISVRPPFSAEPPSAASGVGHRGGSGSAWLQALTEKHAQRLGLDE